MSAILGSFLSREYVSKLSRDESWASTGVRFRLARRLALFIASSAASKMTDSLNRPARTTCSSRVNCFFCIFSGRVKNHDVSALLDIDDIRVLLLNFLVERPFRGGSITGTVTPRRSANEPFLLRWMGSSLMALEREFCAIRKRSRVEKYYFSGFSNRHESLGSVGDRGLAGVVGSGVRRTCMALGHSEREVLQVAGVRSHRCFGVGGHDGASSW